MKEIAELDAKGCYSYKKISAVTLPILASMLMEHVIGMTDTAFLGRVSEVALGASALGMVYFLAFFVLGTGFSFGAQILIARRNGEKEFSEIVAWDINKGKEYMISEDGIFHEINEVKDLTVLDGKHAQNAQK